MFRSLAAGAKVELCLRCEAHLLFTRSTFRGISASSYRAQVSQETDIDRFSDLSNVSSPENSSNTIDHGEKLDQDQPILSSQNSTLRQANNDDLHSDSYTATRLQIHKGHRSIRLNGALTSDPEYIQGHDDTFEHSRSRGNYPAWRHPDVASDRVELGVERLGEPATIRVLPEGIDREDIRRIKPRHKHSSVVQEKKPRQAPTAPLDTLVEAVDSKTDGVAGHAEAFNNIEILRKAFDSSINPIEGASEEECHELGRSLERGFTKVQLQSYSRLAMTMKLPEVDRLESPLVSERYRVSRWYVGPSRWLHNSVRPELYFTLPGIKDYYAICHTGEKDKLGFPIETPVQKEVNRILRLCWGLRSREEKLQKGSAALKIEENWIAMLLQQEKTVFHRVAKLFRVKTKVDSNGIVIVSGAYDACVDAVRVITSEVAAAKMEQIAIIDGKLSISSASSQAAALRDLTSHQGFWEQIGQQTQTKILPVDLDSKGLYRKVKIFYSPSNFKSLPNAQRWISRIRQISKQSFIPYQTIPESKATFPSLIPVPTSASMALIDQHSNWYRWRSLSSRKTSQNSSTETSKKHRDLSLPLAKDLQSIQLSDKLVSPWERTRKQMQKIVKSPASTSEYWESKPRTSLVATFGHLVHAIPDNKMNVLRKSADGTLAIKGALPAAIGKVVQHLFSFRRILTTGVPSLMDALMGLVLDKPAVASFFRIKLIPSSVTKFQSPGPWNGPSLEIDVVINESTKTTSLHQIRLVIDREYVDLALPELAVDARFTTDTLMLGCEGNCDPAITNFLKDCDLDVWGTGQFKTPSMLTLALPVSTLILCTDWARNEVSWTKSDTDGLGKIADKVEKSGKTIERLVADLDAINMQASHTDHPTKTADCESLTVADSLIKDATAEQPGLPSTVATTSLPDDKRTTFAEQIGVQHVSMVYTFDSLAVHSVVRSRYQESTLSFSTIEAGQIGGKQQILQMEASGIADALVRGEMRTREGVDAAKAKFTAFYDSISDLIRRLPR